MRRFKSKKTCRGLRGGVALLAVLAFVLLLTILVVAYISVMKLNRLSTASYSNAIQAQEVANGGLQDILSDFHSEIIAGSINPANNTYTQSGTTIYVPSTNITAVPARLGYPAASWSYGPSAAPSAAPATLLPTLVRVSRASQDGTPTDLYPPNLFASGNLNYTNIVNVPGGAILNRASPVSTGTASVNGRYISPTRWNKPFLLASSTALLPIPFYKSSTALPEPSYPSTPDLPDWVYVTRTGSRVCSTAELASLKTSTNLITSYATPAPGTNPVASPVVGRYAYVVYDEGALLDANAVGSPSSLMKSSTVQTPLSIYTNSPSATPPTPTSLVFTGKSYLAFADLMQLYGFNGGGTTAQSVIDNLINWRNAGGIANANSSYGSGTSAGIAYLGAVFNYSLNGFLQFQSSTLTSVSDSPFLERQDLINYFAKIDSNINTSSATYSQALPYLGTFSRAVNAPSWWPEYDAVNFPTYIGYSNMSSAMSQTSRYNSNAEVSTASPFSSTYPNPNRDIPNVRFQNSCTVTHYLDNATTTNPDGTSSAYVVNAGDPLIQRRFSLSKINWLSQSWAGQADPGTTSATYAASIYPAAIRSCFGLTWGVVSSAINNGLPCWNYVGSPAGSGATAATFNGTIETLDQVAKENREPNFFEILKAGILNGSLGLNAGPCAGSYSSPVNIGPHASSFTDPSNVQGVSGAYNDVFPAGSGGAAAPGRIPDIHIIKIGADIIDQFDSDSFPTAIHFLYRDPVSGSQTATSTADSDTSGRLGAVGMVFGEENVPYLTQLFEIGVCPQSNNSKFCGYLQPEIWNPHQPPNSSNAGYAHLKKLQINAYGAAYFSWQGAYFSNGTEHGYDSSGALQATTSPQWLTSSIVNFLPSPTNPGGGTITITDNTPSGTFSALYEHPYATDTNIPNITITSPDTTHNLASSSDPGYSSNPGTLNAYGNPNNGSLAKTGNPFVAFFCGNTAFNFPQLNAPDVAYSDPVGTGDGGGQVTFGYISPSSIPLTIAIGWVDSAGAFHPYSYMTGLNTYNFFRTNTGSAAGTPDTWLGNDDPDALWSDGRYQHYDPRTDRFSVTIDSKGGQTVQRNQTARPDPSQVTGPGWGSQGSGAGLPSNPEFTNLTSGVIYTESWAENIKTAAGGWYGSMYYTDPDGVLRPGDGSLDVNDPNTITTGNGQMLFHNSNTGSSGGGTLAMSTTAGGPIGRRPIILDRPFRSVGELGYVFRDEPFKTLDFFSKSSADTALLDLFSISDEPAVVAGQVNLNNAPSPVISAILSGGSKQDLVSSYNLSSTESANLAAKIAAQLNPATGPSPIINRADLVGLLNNVILNGGLSNVVDLSNKTYFEGPVRAVANITNTRTWNLMIDIIAQSGQMAANATKLDDFVVQGERRYWLHVAIDRYTGKVVAQQLEPVYE